MSLLLSPATSDSPPVHWLYSGRDAGGVRSVVRIRAGSDVARIGVARRFCRTKPDPLTGLAQLAADIHPIVADLLTLAPRRLMTAVNLIVRERKHSGRVAR